MSSMCRVGFLTRLTSKFPATACCEQRGDVSKLAFCPRTFSHESLSIFVLVLPETYMQAREGLEGMEVETNSPSKVSISDLECHDLVSLTRSII
jgi:hypothetical protein